MEMWLVLLERFAGEAEKLGAPVKVETSGLVVASSSYNKKKQEHMSHVRPHIMAGFTRQSAILVLS